MAHHLRSLTLRTDLSHIVALVRHVYNDVMKVVSVHFVHTHKVWLLVRFFVDKGSGDVPVVM